MDRLSDQVVIDVERDTSEDDITAIPDGILLDYIAGKPVKENGKGHVRYVHFPRSHNCPSDDLYTPEA